VLVGEERVHSVHVFAGRHAVFIRSGHVSSVQAVHSVFVEEVFVCSFTKPKDTSKLVAFRGVYTSLNHVHVFIIDHAFDSHNIRLFVISSVFNVDLERCISEADVF